MYRKIGILVCVLGLFLLATSAAVAQDVEKWYWALTWKETGESGLVAYTIDGVVKPLLENDLVRDTAQGWRLGPDSALALLSEPEQKALYYLTDEAATRITVPEAVSLQQGSWAAYKRSGDYAIIANMDRLPAGPALVVNIATLEARALPAEHITPLYFNALTFSRDGRYLRYAGANDGRWSIREYKLETGDEREIAFLEQNPVAIVTADTYGEHWLHSARERRLIAVDGTVLDTFTMSREQPVARSIFRDDFLRFDSLCVEDCELVFESFESGETRTFTLPEMDGVPQPVIAIDADRMLFLVSDSLWLLNTDGSGSRIGYWTPRFISLPLTSLLSPDRRYLMVLADPDEPAYRVVDLDSGETVMEKFADSRFHLSQIIYMPDGFVMAEDFVRYRFYRYADASLTELPEENIYFDQQGNGLLRAVHSADQGRGIYRYDLESGDSTLIVADAIPIYTRDELLSS